MRSPEGTRVSFQNTSDILSRTLKDDPGKYNQLTSWLLQISTAFEIKRQYRKLNYPTHWACECPTGVPRDPRPMQIAWHPLGLPVLRLAVVLPSKHWRRCGPSRCWCFLISKIGFVLIVILGGTGIELNLSEFGHKKKKTLEATYQRILQDSESLRHCLGSLLCQGAEVWDESQGLNHHFQLRSRQAFHCCW